MRMAPAHTMAATNNGDGSFLITIPSSGAGVSTDDFTAGVYSYVAQVSKGTTPAEVYEVESGRITVTPSLATAVDARSFAKKMIDLIEAALAAGQGVLSVSVSTPLGSRSVAYESRDAMILAREKFRAEYARELQAQGLSSGIGSRRRINVRFGA